MPADETIIYKNIVDLRDYINLIRQKWGYPDYSFSDDDVVRQNHVNDVIDGTNSLSTVKLNTAEGVKTLGTISTPNKVSIGQFVTLSELSALEAVLINKSTICPHCDCNSAPCSCNTAPCSCNTAPSTGYSSDNQCQGHWECGSGDYTDSISYY